METEYGEDDEWVELVGLSDGNEQIEEGHGHGEDAEDDELAFSKLFNTEDCPNVSSDDEVLDPLRLAGFCEGSKPTVEELRILPGQTFKSFDELKIAVQEYEANSGMSFTRLKKNSAWVRMRCRAWVKGDNNSCAVELSARQLKKTCLFTIRKAYLNHTCPSNIHQFRNGSHRAAWVARKIIPHVRINPAMPLSQLNENLRTFHNANSKKWSIQKARVFCKEQIAGGTKETFQRIPAYVKAIRCVDKNAHAFYQTGEDRRFARLYVAPSSSQHLYNFCRPLVGLDGTHTTGKYPMVILFCTCFDGENHIVVLAWAVVKVENYDNWLWFTEHLRLSYPSMKMPKTVFISDRDKGLRAAVGESFPDGNHAHCVQHIRANIKGNIDVLSSKYFKKIAEAKTKQEYEALLTGFKPANERQGKFVEYVRKIDPLVYARHAFPVPRYGHNTSNVVEIINGAVKPCRVFPALQLSEYLWNYVMEKHYQHAQHVNRLPKGPYALTQYANNLYASLNRESRTVKEIHSSDTQSLMIDSKGRWAVHLDDRHCDCMDWFELDFPCMHAMHFLCERGLDAREYTGSVWLAENLVNAYSVPVPPLSIDKLPIAEDHCFEPLIVGKSKKKRNVRRDPSWGEQLARNNDRLVKSRSQKCSLCHQPGHNARKCLVFPPKCATAGASAGASGSGVEPSAESGPSQGGGPHDTLVVNDIHTATRINPDGDWHFFHTRSSLQSYTDHILSQDVINSQTGASQVID